jgi:hypothetical protein
LVGVLELPGPVEAGGGHDHRGFMPLVGELAHEVAHLHRARDAQGRIGVRDDRDALAPRLVHHGPLRHTTRFT